MGEEKDERVMGNNNDRQRLGRRVRAMREDMALTQPQVAQRAGVGAKTISNIERGHIIRPANVVAVLTVFGEHGVEALRDCGFDGWADLVADELENGFDARLDRAVAAFGEYLRSDPRGETQNPRRQHLGSTAHAPMTHYVSTFQAHVS